MFIDPKEYINFLEYKEKINLLKRKEKLMGKKNNKYKGKKVNKRNLVIQCFLWKRMIYSDPNASIEVDDIINDIKTTFNVDVSERHVERIVSELNEGGEFVFNPVCENCGRKFTDDYDAPLTINIDKEDEFDTINKMLNLNLQNVYGDDDPLRWEVEENGTINCKNCSTGVFFSGIEDTEKEEDKKGNNKKKDIFSNEPDFFEVELEKVTACSKIPEKVAVFIETNVKYKIKCFMKWAKREEWLGYLVGEKKDKKDGKFCYIVSDIIIPKQNASGALVNNVNLDDYAEYNIIGVIHSHHEMGGAGTPGKPGFSGHDAEFINSNHNLSILAARDGIAGHVRCRTACGAFMIVPAEIKEKITTPFNMDDLKKDFEDNVNFASNRRVTTTTISYGDGYGDGYGRGCYNGFYNRKKEKIKGLNQKGGNIKVFDVNGKFLGYRD